MNDSEIFFLFSDTNGFFGKISTKRDCKRYFWWFTTLFGVESLQRRTDALHTQRMRFIFVHLFAVCSS